MKVNPVIQILSLIVLPIAWLALEVAPALAAEPPATDALQTRGRELLRKFAEVNRYWLIAPTPTVRNFSYTLNRIGGTQHFEVTDPATAPRAQVQGVTYSALLARLARAPETADVREVVEEPGRVRLTVAFDASAGWAIGNGVEGSWNGYHSFRAGDGFLVLDTERCVPLETGVGRLRETFTNYARVDDRHFVPLAITLKLDATRYDWHFRLHEPGLWLFDEGFSEGRRLAWTEHVKLNGADAQLAEATAESLARADREQAGQARLREFLKANRHWLLPSLATRRGLVYEYRQEAPYLERILFDPEGNFMARLEASQDSPDRATRQFLWLADGRSYKGSAGEQYVKLDASPKGAFDTEFWLQRDAVAQRVALGLGLDCALTRLARVPDTFWAEVKTVPNRDDRYLLVLHSQGDARLFTGTMAVFSSSCFMHDVRYDRSEVLCDAATHYPLEERDFAGEADLKGHYFFDNWLADPATERPGPTQPPGMAPGGIRAIIPYEKDGKDESLEMDARFHFVKAGLWLLERVESRFHGAQGGSTGILTVPPPTADSFQPIRELLERAAMTARVLRTIQQAPVGNAEVKLAPGEWTPFGLQTAWTVKAQQAVKAGGLEAPEPILIGLHRARLLITPQGTTQVELDGLTTGSGKELDTEWKVAWRDGEGRALGTVQTNLAVRAEGGPAPFLLQLDLPHPRGSSPAALERISVEGAVQRLSGAYHGHGLWLRFSNEDQMNQTR